MDFIYKMYIMQTMKTRQIRPNSSFIERLEQDVAYAQKMIVKKVNIRDCLAAATQSVKLSFSLCSNISSSIVIIVVTALIFSLNFSRPVFIGIHRTSWLH